MFIMTITTKIMYFLKHNSLIKPASKKGIPVLASPVAVIPDINFNINLITVTSYKYIWQIILNISPITFWKTVGFLSLLPPNDIILCHTITNGFQLYSGYHHFLK